MNHHTKYDINRTKRKELTVTDGRTDGRTDLIIEFFAFKNISNALDI